MIVENIPQELKVEKRWVLWKYENDTKVPYQTNGTKAKSNDSTTWNTFDNVFVKFEQSTFFDGIGFCVGNGFYGLDFDDAKSLLGWNDVTTDALSTFASYAEISPSGTGVRIILKGEKPEGRCSIKEKENKREIYGKGRFFTITGNKIQGESVLEEQDKVNQFYQKWFQVEKTVVSTKSSLETKTVTVSHEEAIKSIKMPMQERINQANAYLEKCEPTRNGEGASNYFMAVTGCLLWEYALDYDIALNLLSEWGQRATSNGKPYPWSVAEVMHKLNDASKEYKGTLGIGGALKYDVTVANPIIDLKNPRDTAQLFMDKFYSINGKNVIHWHRQDWLVWDEKCYQIYSLDALHSKISNYLSHCRTRDRAGNLIKVCPKKSMEDEIIHQIKNINFLSDSVELPYLEGGNPDNFITFANGRLNVTEWLKNPSTSLSPITPDLISTNYIKRDFNPKAKCPLWEQTLLKVLEPAYISVLQEWSGLLLIPDNRFEKFVIFYGKHGSGKSTISEALESMIGVGNYSNVALDHFNDRWAIAQMYGHTLNVCKDTTLPERKDTAKIVEVLKAITGNDSLSLERKFKDPVNGVKLKTRIIVVSNKLETFNDKGAALKRRVMIFPFRNSIPQDQVKIEFKENIDVELEGITNWALEGLRRLMARRKFDLPVEMTNEIEDFCKSNFVIQNFIEQKCVCGSNYSEKKSDLYDVYCQWCNSTGHISCADNRLFNELKSYDMNITMSGERYYGLKLKHPVPKYTP